MVEWVKNKKKKYIEGVWPHLEDELRVCEKNCKSKIKDQDHSRRGGSEMDILHNNGLGCAIRTPAQDLIGSNQHHQHQQYTCMTLLCRPLNTSPPFQGANHRTTKKEIVK